MGNQILITLNLSGGTRVNYLISQQEWSDFKESLVEGNGYSVNSIRAGLGRIPNLEAGGKVVNDFVADLVLLAAASTSRGEKVLRGTVLKSFTLDEDTKSAEEHLNLARTYGNGSITRH